MTGKPILLLSMMMFVPSLALAQQNQLGGPRPGEMHPPTEQTQNMKASHEFGQKKPQKRPDSFSGQCIVQPGGGQLMAAPCTELVLTLVPEKGGDAISVRTDRDGMFQFTIEQGQTYKLQAGSKHYEVASPTGPIKAAMDVQVQLKQK